MENKAKKNTKEVLLYLLFGVLTTAVSWIVRFGILWPGKALFDIKDNISLPFDQIVALLRGEITLAMIDQKILIYTLLFTVASVISWVCAVLFAFFTNRAFVFKDADKKANVWKQMAEFFGGRLATFVLFEWLLNLGIVMLLGAILPETMEFLTVDLSAYRGAAIEVVATGVASVANIVANYLIGKFLVFKKAKKQPEEQTE